MINVLKYGKLFLLIICFSSCASPKREDIDNSVYEKLMDSISESIMGIQFKGLEANGASEVFERYKIIKIKVIRNTFLKQNADSEIKALREIRNEFNNLIMDDVMLESIEDGDRENPYIKEFEYLFIEQLVKQAEPNMVISISNLKIILDN